LATRRDIVPAMPSRDTGSLLRQSPVFAALPAREVEALAAVAVEEAHRTRDYIFMEGDPARWFCVVKSGRVKILRHSRAGKDVVLELLGPGEVFGGVAVIEQRPYPAAAQATEATVVLKIPADAMIAVAERHPSVIKAIALMIGRRLRTAHDSVESLAVDPAEARLAAALLRLAEREGARGRPRATLPFHLTRQSLADMTGTTVETTIRVVSRWLKEGLLEDDGARLALSDVEALRARAEGEAR
jgi:CRP/FNR family transcriptional regulator